jgi:hypothetical protein
MLSRYTARRVKRGGDEIFDKRWIIPMKKKERCAWNVDSIA